MDFKHGDIVEIVSFDGYWYGNDISCSIGDLLYVISFRDMKVRDK